MAIVDRVKAICLKPKDEWQVIAGETSTTQDLLKNYALPLAAIGAVAGFIGMSLIGVSGFGITIRTPVGSGLIGAIFRLALSLVSVYLVAILINELAPKFGGEKNLSQALKVAVYSFTPVWVASVLFILPMLGLLVLGAVGYAIYILYLGLLTVMKSPKDKATVYTVVVVLVGLVLGWIISAVVNSFTSAGTVAAVGLPGIGIR